MIPFGNFAPDLPSLCGMDKYDQPRSPRAVNVIPGTKGYLPFLGASVVSATALAAQPKGGYAAKLTSGTILVVAGSNAKLYRLTASVVSDVTRASGGDYTVATDDQWSFVQFRNKLIATQIGDDIQYFDLATPGTNFAILATSTLKPKAKYVAAVGEFPMFANTSEGGTLYPNRVRWPKIANERDFDELVSAQSDHQDLPDGGQITGLTGAQDYGVVFTEATLWRADYQGGDLIFTFSKIQNSKGCQIPGSIAGYDQGVFYYAPGGFMHYDGVSSRPIGDEQVDAYFLTDLDYNNRYRVTSTVDPVNKLYVIAYPGAGNVSGRPNNWLIYRWDTGQWASLLSVQIESLFQSFTQGFTLEGLDVFGTMDTLPASLDSNLWKGGRYLLAGIDANYYFCTFNGDPLTAEVDTAEMSLVPGQLGWVDTIRPIVEGNGDTIVTVKTLTRDSQKEDYTTSGALTPESTGEVVCPQDAARYHRFRMIIEGGFDHAEGFDDLIVVPQGAQ